MQKIYSVVNGKLMLIILNLIMVFCTSIILIVLPISGLEWLYLILFDLILFVLPQLIFCLKFHCLNYIKVSSVGVAHKNNMYSWDNVCITMVSVSAFGGYKYNFRIFFCDDFYTKEETNKANREGFWIDLTTKRIELILSYYKKEIRDLTKHQNSKGPYNIVNEHNRVVSEQKEK